MVDFRRAKFKTESSQVLRIVRTWGAAVLRPYTVILRQGRRNTETEQETRSTIHGVRHTEGGTRITRHGSRNTPLRSVGAFEGEIDADCGADSGKNQDEHQEAIAARFSRTFLRKHRRRIARVLSLRIVWIEHDAIRGALGD